MSKPAAPTLSFGLPSLEHCQLASGCEEDKQTSLQLIARCRQRPELRSDSIHLERWVMGQSDVAQRLWRKRLAALLSILAAICARLAKGINKP